MRVVSLLPGATDAIIALGTADVLVGVSHACDISGAGVPEIARVTSPALDATASSAAIDAAVREAANAGLPPFALDAGAIGRLRPDLIVTQALCDVCAVDENDVRALAAGLPSVPRVLTWSGNSIDGILDDVVRLGGAIGADAEADELVVGIRARMRSVHLTLKAARAPRPRVAVLEWTDPLFNAGHWVPEQVRRAGGIAVLGEAGAHSRAVTPDDLAAADPEIVVVAPCGFSIDRAIDEAQRVIATTAWLAGRQVWAIDGNTLTSRPGPGLANGVETLAHIVAPTLFARPSDRAARRCS